MKKRILKNRKGSLKNALAGFALMLVASLLFIGCGASKKTSEPSADSVTDVAKPQDTENQLQDDCALLHIYRKGSMAGAAIGYDIYLDNQKVFRAKNKSKTTIKITKEGVDTLSAKTETKVELPINIQFGKEYYIRCGIKMGAFVGRPKLEAVDNQTGKAEFEEIPLKTK